MRAAILRVTASRLLFLSACLSMLITVAQAADRPSPYLKGVTTMTYNGFINREDKGRCKTDWKAWNTAIDFVANQSTKLKLMTDVEHDEQIEQMKKKDDIEALLKKGLLNWTDEDNRRYQDEIETRSKVIGVPRLSFVISTIELESGCAAVIEAEVKAPLKPSTMISTGARVPYPDFSVWSKTWTLQSPQQSFSRLAIETSERIMKEFVNDWTASQTLP
jgi:hypothetical protein